MSSLGFCVIKIASYYGKCIKFIYYLYVKSERLMNVIDNKTQIKFNIIFIYKTLF